MTGRDDDCDWHCAQPVSSKKKHTSSWLPRLEQSES